MFRREIKPVFHEFSIEICCKLSFFLKCTFSFMHPSKLCTCIHKHFALSSLVITVDSLSNQQFFKVLVYYCLLALEHFKPECLILGVNFAARGNDKSAKNGSQENTVCHAVAGQGEHVAHVSQKLTEIFL